MNKQTNSQTPTTEWWLLEAVGGQRGEGVRNKVTAETTSDDKHTADKCCINIITVHLKFIKTLSTNVTPVNLIFKHHIKGGGGSQAFMRRELCDSPAPVCHFSPVLTTTAGTQACVQLAFPGRRESLATQQCAVLQPETMAGTEEGLSICQVAINFTKFLPISPRYV